MPLQSFIETFRRLPTQLLSGAAKINEPKVSSMLNAGQVSVCNPQEFKAEANGHSFRNIAFVYANISSAVDVALPPVNYARLQISLLGSGTTTVDGVTVPVRDDLFCVISPQQYCRVSCDAAHVRLTLRIKESALHQTLTNLLGAPPKGSLSFQPSLRLDQPHVRGLLKLMNILAQELRRTSTDLSQRTLSRLEEALSVAFLDATQHSFSHLLQQDAQLACPLKVREAEAFIEANWNRPISIEDLTTLTNASARSLFKSFSTARGYTPMAFLKMTRLNHAKEMLSSGNSKTSVTSVAFYCGFSNLGHFAKDYKRTFGQLPSETLARSRH